VSGGLAELGYYQVEIGQTPLLGPREELRLARKVARGDRRARQHMIRANLRLVVAVAKRYRGRGLAFGDLVQAGNVGLVRAADWFKPGKGTRFASYAGVCIRWEVRREIGRRVGRMASVDAMREENMLGEVEDKASRRPLEESRARQDADTLLSCLRDREAVVLRRRYGVGTGHPETLSEIAGALGLTRQRVQQIEARAVRKVQAAAEKSAQRAAERRRSMCPAPAVGLTRPGSRR